MSTCGIGAGSCWCCCYRCCRCCCCRRRRRCGASGRRFVRHGYLFILLVFWFFWFFFSFFFCCFFLVVRLGLFTVKRKHSSLIYKHHKSISNSQRVRYSSINSMRPKARFHQVVLRRSSRCPCKIISRVCQLECAALFASNISRKENMRRACWSR